MPSMVRDLYRTLAQESIPHEIVVVDDGSRDSTWQVLEALRREVPTLRCKIRARAVLVAPLCTVSITARAMPL